MKLCWDNIINLRLTRNNNFNIGTHTYIEQTCQCCGDICLVRADSKKQYCSNSCKSKAENPMKNKDISAKITGRNNILWKGGVRKDGLPLYDTYAHQIEFADNVRKKTNKNGLVLLEVECTKCKKWFVPDDQSIWKRIACLKGNRLGESRLYCSDECKQSCNIYRAHTYPKDFSYDNYYNSYEYGVWRNKVLKSVDYVCEYCGKTATDAHHIQPKKLEPFFALDPDNGIACCEECHYKYGHKNECSTGNLANIICK